ncbi:MAG: DUF4126 domain-containing protein [Desulfobacterota bacterium]|nr:DUF4126 domain-containing protein [Thermodesulfobacteriota bacterium]
MTETLLGIAIGIGLSAACGFRVFVPLLVMNLASLAGHLHLSPGFEWIGSEYATLAFGIATVVEILGYYIPWVDQCLDLIATPAAILAGTIVTASMVMELSPFLKWTLAIIAGGGAAALVQGSTVALRTKSTTLTGGMGNPLVSTAEAIGSLITSLLAILVPILCLVLLALLIFWAIRKAGRLIFRRTKIP